MNTSSSSSSSPKPILKWVGSKAEQAERVAALFAGHRGVFCSPFLGAGSVELRLLATGAVDPAQVILGDANTRLMAMYRAVQADPEGVFSELALLPSSAEAAKQTAAELGLKPVPRRMVGGARQPCLWNAYYLRARSVLNEWHPGSLECASAAHAALFLWLNKAAFNGLARVNRANESNVAVADKITGLPDLHQLCAVSQHLQGVRLVAGDFSETLSEAQRLVAEDGAAVYADPPYHDKFVEYTPARFYLEDQERLAHLLGALAQAGWTVVAQNAGGTTLDALYAACGFSVQITQASTRVSCVVPGRGKTSELLATANLPEGRP